MELGWAPLRKVSIERWLFFRDGFPKPLFNIIDDPSLNNPENGQQRWWSHWYGWIRLLLSRGKSDVSWLYSYSLRKSGNSTSKGRGCVPKCSVACNCSCLWISYRCEVQSVGHCAMQLLQWNYCRAIVAVQLLKYNDCSVIVAVSAVVAIQCVVTCAFELEHEILYTFWKGFLAYIIVPFSLNIVCLVVAPVCCVIYKHCMNCPELHSYFLNKSARPWVRIFFLQKIACGWIATKAPVEANKKTNNISTLVLVVLFLISHLLSYSQDGELINLLTRWQPIQQIRKGTGGRSKPWLID